MEDIRELFADAVAKLDADVSVVEKVMAVYTSAASRLPEASWWIDHRDDATRALHRTLDDDEAATLTALNQEARNGR